MARYTAGVATKPYKAVAGFILTFLGLVVQALVGQGDAGITVREWAVIVIGSLVTAGAVYGITNPPTGNGTVTGT